MRFHSTILLPILASSSHASLLRRELGRGKGGKPDNVGLPPHKRPDWVAPCSEDDICREGKGKRPTFYFLCKFEDGEEVNSCMPERSDLFNTTLYPNNYCGVCVTPAPVTASPVIASPVDARRELRRGNGNGNGKLPPHKRPGWVAPCSEDDLCRESSGNGPNFYSLCKLVDGEEVNSCTPEVSKLFDKPTNYCGVCSTPAPVTPAPVTPAPVTPAPVTPAPVTPAPVTSAPVTSAPVTTEPVDTRRELGRGRAKGPGKPDKLPVPPFKRPAWVAPCPAGDMCREAKGNGPNFYSLCTFEAGEEVNNCLPEVSNEFKNPDNYCGACVTPAPVTAAPVTLEPIV